MEQLAAIEPQQAKTDALIRLYRIGRGELPREQEIFARRQLREANRELRAREKENSRRSAWRLFWGARRAVMRGRQLSAAERTELIFALYRPAPPPSQPMVSAEALVAELVAAEEPPRSAEELQDQKELMSFIRERQKDMGLAPLGQLDPEPAAPAAQPGPAGHWKAERIPGRFGAAAGAYRRTWVTSDSQEGSGCLGE
jgi:hypothetical protein